MKKVLVAMMVLLAATSALAAGGKIAFVDTQTVFDKAKVGKKYQGILKEYYESRKKILDLDADEIQKLREDYGKQAPVMKPEARKEKDAEFLQGIPVSRLGRPSRNSHCPADALKRQTGPVLQHQDLALWRRQTRGRRR